MYNYGYSSYAADIASKAAAAGIVLLLAVVAIVVLTIVGYVKFLGKNSDRKSGLGRFFHFDHFYIEQVLRFLYLFSAVSITVVSVSNVLIAAFMGGAAAFFMSLIGSILLFFVSQFFCRIMFENALIGIRQAVDVRALRSKIVGDVAATDAGPESIDEIKASLKWKSKQGSSNPMNATVDVAAGAGNAQSASHASGEAWRCPTCGNVGTGKFCGRCGSPRV